MNKFSQARPLSRNLQKLHPVEISDTMVYVITRLLGTYIKIQKPCLHWKQAHDIIMPLC